MGPDGTSGREDSTMSEPFAREHNGSNDREDTVTIATLSGGKRECQAGTRRQAQLR
jgi:hypothetical protein